MSETKGAAARGPSWPGETVFIVAGGPSVLDQNLDMLRGHRVIAIKGGYISLPFADVLYFADHFWWRATAPKDRGNGPKVVASGFAGEVLTTSPYLSGDPHAGRLTFRKAVKTFSENPAELFVRRTSVTAAVNEAWHRRAKACVLLGVDGVTTEERTHHYPDDNGRTLPKNWQDEQAKDFQHLTAETTRLGMTVINASPVSIFDFWPRAKLEDCL